MRDYQVIKKIKELKQIKPNKDWALLTKQDVLEKIEEVSQTTKEILGWFPLPRPVFLVGALGVAVLFVIVLVAIGQIKVLPQPVELSLQESQALLVSLNQLEKTLTQATDNIKKMQGPENVLEMKEVVATAVKDGERVLSRAKRVRSAAQPKEEILTALNGVESALSEMKEASQEVEREIAAREIEEWQARTLTQEQEEILKQAQEYFEDGKYAKALEKMIEASQN